MYKLFVFDWNGTILADTIPSWKAANIALQFYGVPDITLKQYRDTFHFPVIHFYQKNGVDTDTMLAHKEESNALFQSAYEKLAAKSRTRHGARELLACLQGQSADCIILSNYLTGKIAGHLKRLKIGQHFSQISAHDCDGSTILQHTTKTERLAAYMRQHHYRPEETVIIGDSMEEPAIARQLGLTSIGITDGYISRARLRAAKPDHLIHKLTDILPLLQ